jgi:hypothetical protein
MNILVIGTGRFGPVAGIRLADSGCVVICNCAGERRCPAGTDQRAVVPG